MQKTLNLEKKTNWRALIGWALLSLTIIALLISTIIEAWRYHSISGIVTLVVLIGALIAVGMEAKRVLLSSPERADTTHLILQAFSVFAGAILAFLISHDLGLGPVVAASIVGIIAHLILPKYSIPIYCGAFVGMTSNVLLFSYGEVAIAGIISAIVYNLTEHNFAGFGGKLGTIALIGTAITCMSLGREFLILPIADLRTNLIIILVGMIATPLTFYLNAYKNHGPTMASAFVGLLGGLILPAIFPVIGGTLAVVAICASFAGMTSERRCPNKWHILITGLFTSIVFVYSTPLLGGAGGKLGTIAFGAVLSTCGLTRFAQWIIQRAQRKQKTE